MPVAIDPQIPPIPWTAKTSSASSTPILFLRSSTAKKQATPAPNPIAIADDGETKPEAGVIATNPATAPAAAPSTLGCPCRSQLTVIQVSAPIAAAMLVTTNAFAARPLAPSALPALNPNQPNQRRPAPSTV